MFAKKIGYYFTRFVILIFKITPFFIIYLLSDFLYFIFFRVVKYRKKIVISNLNKVFPDKTVKEINIIAKKFYKNLADITIESVKGFAMSKKQMLKRFKALNPEIANKYFDQNKDIVVLAAHYANWEWGAVACATQFKHKTAVLYKPLSNPFLDKYIREKRARFGVELVPISETKEFFAKEKSEKTAYIMVADQNPSNPRVSVWVNFLGQQTPFLHGPEKYAKMLKTPVVYFDVVREKRGFYTFKVIDVTKDASKFNENELTKIFADILEKIIYKNPSDWLWSHRRWKHKLPTETNKQ